MRTPIADANEKNRRFCHSRNPRQVSCRFQARDIHEAERLTPPRRLALLLIQPRGLEH